MSSGTQDSIVQIGDKKIRNVQAAVLQPDGTVAQVQMQIVTLCDSDGNLVDLDQSVVLQHMLDEMKKQRVLLDELVKYFVGVRFSGQDLESLSL